MWPRKGTPEYEAWRNSPEYVARNKKLSESKKGKRFSDEARANMSAAQKASYANLTDEEREKRRIQNEVGLSKGRVSREHTEETKAKISTNNKGKVPPNKGKPMSDEQKKKMSEIAKKRPPRPPEVVAKYIGKFIAAGQTKEARAKQAKTLMGHNVSDETRAKIKEARKDQPPTFLGRRHTEESKKKMAIAASKSQRTRYDAMSQEELDALAERRMRSIRQKKSSLEVFVADQLDASGILYKPQRHIGRYVVDFFFPEQDIILEVNGCYWHSCEECGFGNENLTRKERDVVKLAYLEQAGYMVIILWEHDVIPYMKAAAKDKRGSV